MNSPKKRLHAAEFINLIVWTFKLFYKIDRVKTVLVFILRPITETTYILYPLIQGLILDTVINIAQSENKDLRPLGMYLGLYLALNIIDKAIIETITWYAQDSMSQTSRLELDRIFFEKLQSLGIQTLENPDVANQIKLAERWLPRLQGLLRDSFRIVGTIIRVGITVVAVLQFSPTIVIVLVLISIVKFLPDIISTQNYYNLTKSTEEESRIAGSSEYKLAQPSYLQEINITGAYNFLLQKSIAFRKKYDAQYIKLLKIDSIVAFGKDTVDAIVYLLGSYLVYLDFILGRITLGTVTFRLRTISMLDSSLSNALRQVKDLNEYAVNLIDVVALFKLESEFKDGTVKFSTNHKKTPPTIEFVNVSFKYPQSEMYVFENLSFKINAGEKLALVGHNGAGKTTIVKLLTRFYRPTSGKILINGIDLNEIELETWYKQMAVLFQTYNHYSELTAEENIFIGDTSKEVYKEDIITAANNADAHEFISKFPKQYEQRLGENYKEGLRPSTGQWQRIALARFFYRDSSMIIFDEPTSAIDAVAEYKIFNKVYETFNNKTVIIISHRFSTVRNADKIFVIEKGNIIEEGTHEQLMDIKGEYAKAFLLQAEGYKEKVD